MILGCLNAVKQFGQADFREGLFKPVSNQKCKPCKKPFRIILICIGKHHISEIKSYMCKSYRFWPKIVVLDTSEGMMGWVVTKDKRYCAKLDMLMLPSQRKM